MVVVAAAVVMVDVVWMVSVETGMLTRVVWMVVIKVSLVTDVVVAVGVFVARVGGTVGSEDIAVVGDVGRANVVGGMELTELSVCSITVPPGVFWEVVGVAGGCIFMVDADVCVFDGASVVSS